MPISKSSIRIKSIKVTALFGLYDHQVTLNNERVTVIHGPNGVGKTVFLKLTNAFLKGRYNEIARVPFRSFEILFNDGSIAKIQNSDESSHPRKFTISVSSAGQNSEASIDSDSISSERLARHIENYSPYIKQLGPDEWIDRRTEEVLSSDELVARAGDILPKEAKQLTSKEPKALRELRGRINVHFIEAQRLIRLASNSSELRYRATNEGNSTATVLAYSRDLKRKLETALANYAKVSQKLDQSFPQRLLAGSNPPMNSDNLKREMQEVEAIRDKLKNIGVLDKGDPAQDAYPLQILQLESLQDNQRSVMSVYARDTKEKLAVLQELSGRIEILLSVLNRKFTNKLVSISRDSGLVISGSNGKPIPVTALSSGEQHELVLLYDLLFKVDQDTLVLIDEPELSLHISWQKGFMDDLLEIIRVAHFDVLMATHSPYIVGERSDLLVVLSPDVGA
jgi:energy-coupling factor transporter ATP-binding protein EcfA2